MRCRPTSPSVGGVYSRPLLRIGAAAAILGAVTHIAASALYPAAPEEPDEAIRVVSESGFFVADRLLDLVSVFLTVGALIVVACTLSSGPGRDATRTFLAVMGALWAGAVLTGAALEDVADAWADAASGARQGYVAAFDATTSVADALWFGTVCAWGVFLGALGVSLLAEPVYRRWIAWAAACGGALMLGGVVLALVWDVAFLAAEAGSMLFRVVLVALGVSLWRRAAPRRAASLTFALKGEI